METQTCLFISPHLDDAVLSCGGYINQLVMSGNRVVIATVFTADPPAGIPLSWLMRANHIRWGIGDKPFALRCQEDARAARVLGTDYAHLGLMDAMYRRSKSGLPFYQKDTVLIPIDPEDEATTQPLIRQKLEALIKELVGPNLQVFCPLGMGEHVDHILTRQAVECIVPTECISYYEEFPYVIRPNAFAHWEMNHRDDMVDLVCTKIALSSNDVERRINAIACYTSQITFLFPTAMQGWHGLFHVYLPWTAKVIPLKPNREDTCRRISMALRGYIARSGGECYWSRALIPFHQERPAEQPV